MSAVNKTSENTCDFEPFDALVLQPDKSPHDSNEVKPLSILDPRNDPVKEPRFRI
ncbi:hypothetical protein DPMN_079626 [Dreissena polymorpha]|uniref:Uncharacterized protein n=1 Tax=Dreissena polymorpha TaxID=45954 RepID=A0A9D4BQ88_DREPO|nr:hypothetical protein DPMN_079626 [Dreissena polymorpha]